MASLKVKAKVLARSRSLRFTRHYFGERSGGALASYDWNGIPVSYRPGTSDTELIYSILLKQGRKSEYALPDECRLDADSVRTVLDIGANIGVSALYLASVFTNATVHAFEPEPGNCEVLRANAAKSRRIEVHPFALGAADGELTLFDSDNPANFGGFSSHGMGVDTGRSKRVPVRHAGRALADIGIRSVDVIKIDTEGAEWEILTAMDKELLGSTQLILGELHGRRDFELLAYLQPMFDIGMKKQIKTRLFNFYAVNREQNERLAR